LNSKSSRCHLEVPAIEGYDRIGFAVKRCLKNELVIRVVQLRPKPLNQVYELAIQAKCLDNPYCFQLRES